MDARLIKNTLLKLLSPNASALDLGCSTIADWLTEQFMYLLFKSRWLIESFPFLRKEGLGELKKGDRYRRYPFIYIQEFIWQDFMFINFFVSIRDKEISIIILKILHKS